MQNSSVSNSSINTPSFFLKPLCVSLALVMGSVSLVACGGSNDNSSSSSSTVGTASVSAIVKDTSGNPLSNVGLYDSDNTSDVETSNSAGYVYIGKLTNANNSLINLVAAGYAKQSLLLPLSTNPTLTNLNVQMLKLVAATDGTDAIAQSGDSSKTFTSGSSSTGSQIALTYANLIASGTATAVTSNVTVYLTDISTSQLGVLPNGLASTVAVYGATNLQMNDVFVPTTTQTSDPYGQLSLVGLKSAAPIKIAVTGTNLPATTSLYYFDESAKAWKTDGTLTLTTENGSQYYTGTTTHTGYLVAGATVSATQTITGTVKDSSGNAIANAQIIATAPNGTATAYSSSTGTYSLSVPQTATNQSVTLTAVKGNLTTTGSNTAPNLVLTLPTTTTSTTASSTLTWTKSASNLDLNVMLPTGEIVYLNNVGSTSTDPYVALTQGTLQDSLNYKQMLVGTHRIFVYNIGRTFNPSISGASTSVAITAGSKTLSVIPQATYTSTDKEITSETTPMYDNRSMAWYVADMKVNSDCSVTLSEPDTTTYRRWLDSTQFATVANVNNANSKNYMQIRLDGTAQTMDGTGAYCSAN